MSLKRLALSIGVWTACLHTAMASAHILESFTITTQNVEVSQFRESTIQFRSGKSAYTIMLEPHKQGKVMFALSGIGCAATLRAANLRFDVRIIGYRNDVAIQPSYTFDNANKGIVVEAGRWIFQRIYGAVPIWFDEQVDSIHLQFSNSHAIEMDQYLGIHDLKLVTQGEVVSNPQVNPCQGQRVMIAIDGSASIDKKERALIGTHLMKYIKKSGFTRDSNTMCVLEFGTDILSVVESTEKKELVEALQNYKSAKQKTRSAIWSNWTVAFDEALLRRPEVLILFTDGLSNWSEDAPRTFSAQYEELVAKSNALKAKGTRLMFVMSDAHTTESARSLLKTFLNSEQTRELPGDMVTRDVDLKEVDMISMQGFAKMRELNLSSMTDCPPEMIEEIPSVAEHSETGGRKKS